MQLPRVHMPRAGNVVVEFAFVGVVFIFLILGALEFGRALMVVQNLNDAARRACRTGIQAGTSTATIQADALDALNDTNLRAQATVTVLVNGANVDAATAVRGDQISVQISVPDAAVSWTPYLFLRGYNLQSVPVVMMRQQ
jgi:Flp pilus assembly protein TadG